LTPSPSTNLYQKIIVEILLQRTQATTVGRFFEIQLVTPPRASDALQQPILLTTDKNFPGDRGLVLFGDPGEDAARSTMLRHARTYLPGARVL
jgi:hypothetical protein